MVVLRNSCKLWNAPGYHDIWWFLAEVFSCACKVYSIFYAFSCSPTPVPVTATRMTLPFFLTLRNPNIPSYSTRKWVLQLHALRIDDPLIGVEPKIGGYSTPQNGWWKFHGKPLWTNGWFGGFYPLFLETTPIPKTELENIRDLIPTSLASHWTFLFGGVQVHSWQGIQYSGMFTKGFRYLIWRYCTL